MKLSTLMITKAMVCITLGAAMLLAPGFLFSIFGASLNDGGTFAAREYGAAMIGACLLTWYARNADASKARRAIILDLFVYDAIGVVITVYAMITRLFNPLGWLILAIYLFFAIGYGYFWFAKPVPAEMASTA